MPSYAQLQAEPWWGREIVTDELDWLGDQLCTLTGRTRDAFGTKGNNVHLNGGHRSQEWIRNSDYCTNRSYTVQSGLSETQARHIAACDFTPGAWGTSANRQLMVKQTKALWDAAKAGRLAGLRQVFGTLDGQRAIGLNVVSGSITYPDDSHLDHWHLTFDRTHMRDAGLMQRILATVLIGDDDMSAADVWNHPIYSPSLNFGGPAGEWLKYAVEAARSAGAAVALLEKIAEKVDVDPAELAQIREAARAGAEAGVVGSAEALASAIAGELGDELGLDAAEVQAAAERAVRKVLGTLDNPVQ